MENTVDSVVFLFDEVVSRDVEDNEPLELLQVDDLLDLVNLVVSQVKLHQSLHVLETTQSLNLVVFKTQLGQALQLV